MNKLFLLTFDGFAEDKEALLAFLDEQKEITDWHTSMSNTIFVETALDFPELVSLLRSSKSFGQAALSQCCLLSHSAKHRRHAAVAEGVLTLGHAPRHCARWSPRAPKPRTCRPGRRPCLMRRHDRHIPGPSWGSSSGEAERWPAFVLFAMERLAGPRFSRLWAAGNARRPGGASLLVYRANVLSYSKPDRSTLAHETVAHVKDVGVSGEVVVNAIEETIDATLDSAGQLKLSHKPQMPPGPVRVTIRAATGAGPRRGLADVIQEVAAEQRSRGYAGRSARDVCIEEEAQSAEDAERDRELDAARRAVGGP